MVQVVRRLRTSPLPRWAAVMAWMALVFYLSSQPSLPMLSDRFGALQSLAGHFVEYAILALLLQWALRGNPSKGNGLEVSRAALWAFVIAVTYGFTDEVHQHFVPGRTMDPFDLLTDAVGAAAALLVAGLAIGHRLAASLANERPPSDLP
jgi:VanZ family protein